MTIIIWFIRPNSSGWRRYSGNRNVIQSEIVWRSKRMNQKLSESMKWNGKGCYKVKGINNSKRDVMKHQLIMVVNTHRLSHVKSTRMTNHHFTTDYLYIATEGHKEKLRWRFLHHQILYWMLWEHVEYQIYHYSWDKDRRKESLQKYLKMTLSHAKVCPKMNWMIRRSSMWRSGLCKYWLGF